MKPTTLLIASSLLIGACSSSDDELFALDDKAVAEGADGKSDDAPGMVRLERATPAEVAASFAEVRGTEMRECFAAYKAQLDPSATMLTASVAEKFIDVAIATNDAACEDWAELLGIVQGVLKSKDLTEMEPEELIGELQPWVLPTLTASTEDGFVVVTGESVRFYDDIKRVQLANAMAREQDPTGIDLAAIRAAWREVRTDVALDSQYLNPVTFAPGALDGSDVFRNLRRAFPLDHQSLDSAGHKAVDNFAEAHEGPEGDPAFDPIRKAFHLPSITKRFYFAGSDEEWSSNTLIVVDEHGQAYGMQMGYSE